MGDEHLVVVVVPGLISRTSGRDVTPGIGEFKVKHPVLAIDQRLRRRDDPESGRRSGIDREQATLHGSKSVGRCQERISPGPIHHETLKPHRVIDHIRGDGLAGGPTLNGQNGRYIRRLASKGQRDRSGEAGASERNPKEIRDCKGHRVRGHRDPCLGLLQPSEALSLGIALCTKGKGAAGHRAQGRRAARGENLSPQGKSRPGQVRRKT